MIIKLSVSQIGYNIGCIYYNNLTINIFLDPEELISSVLKNHLLP